MSRSRLCLSSWETLGTPHSLCAFQGDESATDMPQWMFGYASKDIETSSGLIYLSDPLLHIIFENLVQRLFHESSFQRQQNLLTCLKNCGSSSALLRLLLPRPDIIVRKWPTRNLCPFPMNGLQGSTPQVGLSTTKQVHFGLRGGTSLPSSTLTYEENETSYCTMTR